MKATHKRLIRDGQSYDRFFPRAKGGVQTVRRNASLEDTMALIPRLVRQFQGQTRAITAHLRGASLYETCSNIWQFVYHHIQYEIDRPGYEQIRSPARTWHDRGHGVDCDCYSVFISSILLNLQISHILRITQYQQAHFQHIYPVVPTPSGEIILDCVTNRFNYEVPYKAKKDYPMDLQILNGLDGTESNDPNELGKLKINVKKVLNAVNKFNPATVLLRNGLLASMKLNIGGVAGKLRWSYLTSAQAAAKKINASKLAKLVKVRTSLEKIFFGAGGQLKNLKKAILKGKGNKDKAVLAGLESLDGVEEYAYTIHDPLPQLLGAELYDSENERSFQGLDGFGALGEPLTITSVTAASGVIVKLVAALKKIGGLFSGKGGEDSGEATSATGDDSSSPDASNASNTNASSSTILPGRSDADSDSAGTSTVVSNPAANTPLRVQSSHALPAMATDSSDDGHAAVDADSDSTATVPATSATAYTTPVLPASAAGSDDPAATGNPDSFWAKNKRWLKPAMIGAGGLTVVAIGYHLLKPPPRTGGSSLSGMPRKHPHKKKRSKKRSHKKAVALL